MENAKVQQLVSQLVCLLEVLGQASKRNTKIFLRRFPLSRFLAKTLRVNKAAMESPHRLAKYSRDVSEGKASPSNFSLHLRNNLVIQMVIVFCRNNLLLSALEITSQVPHTRGFLYASVIIQLKIIQFLIKYPLLPSFFPSRNSLNIQFDVVHCISNCAQDINETLLEDSLIFLCKHRVFNFNSLHSSNISCC